MQMSKLELNHDLVKSRNNIGHVLRLRVHIAKEIDYITRLHVPHDLLVP